MILKNIVVTDKTAAFFSIAFIIALGLFVYGNSVNGQFIWDDELLIKNNEYIRDWHNVPRILTESCGAGSGHKGSFYRPVQTLTYLVDYHIWGLNPGGYHLTSIILHILVSVCVYWLVWVLYRDVLLSALAGLFFVVHPIHTEAVSYLSGRADILALLFMLLCSIAYIRPILTSKHNKVFIVLMVVSYSLALLSKENSLILPALLILFHMAFKKKINIATLSLLSIALIYLIARAFLLKQTGLDLSLIALAPARLPGFFIAVINYVRLLFLPFGLHMEYGNKLFQFTDPEAMLGMLMACLLLFYAFKKRNSNNILFYSITWFFLGLLPVSNIYPLPFYMAEHYLYLPSIGFFILLAYGITRMHRIERLKAPAKALILILLVFYSFLTVKQNDYWQEPIGFYERTLAYAPESVRIYTMLGRAYLDSGRKREAAAAYEKAIELDPSNAGLYYEIGKAYIDRDEYRQAIKYHTKAAEINSDFAGVYNELGFAYNALGDTARAVEAYKKSLAIYPDDPIVNRNLKILKSHR